MCIIYVLLEHSISYFIMFLGFKSFLSYMYLIFEDIFPINKYALSILYKLCFEFISNTNNIVK